MIDEKSKLLLKKLSALSCLRDKGIDYACRLYPELEDFLIENKDKPYEEVKKELLRSAQN